MTAPQDEPVAWMDVGNFDALKGETNGGIQCFLYRSRPYEKSAPLYAQSPAAVRAAAIAECARVGRNLYKGDGGRLDAYDEGWNDGVEAAECAIRALSPRPTVSEAEIIKHADKNFMPDTPLNIYCRDSIRAALQALGYEVKP